MTDRPASLDDVSMGEWLTGKIPNEEARDATALHGDVEVEVGGLPGLQVDVSGEDPEGGRSTGGSSWVTEEGNLMTDYAKLRELAEQATPGPWEVRWDGEEPWNMANAFEDLPDDITVGAGTYLTSGGRSWTSADLILEKDVSGAAEDEIATIAATATYVAAADPQTMIALLDERDEQTETIRLFTLTNEGHVDRIAGLQARIDAALAAIEGGLRDPIITPQDGYQYGFRNALHLVRAALSTPTENGEEQ